MIVKFNLTRPQAVGLFWRLKAVYRETDQGPASRGLERLLAALEDELSKDDDRS